MTKINDTIKCSECGAEMDRFDKLYSWERGWICDFCFDGKIHELSRDELAELVGSEVRIADDLLWDR